MPTQTSFPQGYVWLKRGVRAFLEVGLWLSVVGGLIVIAREVLARGF